MELSQITNSNIFFTPVNIEKEEEISLVKVAVLAKTFFNQPLGNHPYIIEEECYATCDGDFVRHVFNPTTVGHGPKPIMIRYGFDSTDELSTTFSISEETPFRILNGSLNWTIPVYLFDISCDSDGTVKKEKLILDTTKPKEIEVPYKEGTAEVDFEQLFKMYKPIARIEVVQQFVLENGILRMSKNGVNLLNLDLKQYTNIFPSSSFS